MIKSQPTLSLKLVAFYKTANKSFANRLDEIGERYDLSRERIRQILETALNKLRNPKRMMKLKDFKDFN